MNEKKSSHNSVSNSSFVEDLSFEDPATVQDVDNNPDSDIADPYAYEDQNKYSEPKVILVPVPTVEFGYVGIGVLIFIGLLTIYSISSIPNNIVKAFTEIGSNSFWLITIPLLMQSIIVCFLQYKNYYSLINDSMKKLLVQNWKIGLIIFGIVGFIVVSVSSLMDDTSFLKWLFITPMGLLLYLPSFFVASIPFLIIESAIIKRIG